VPLQLQFGPATASLLVYCEEMAHCGERNKLKKLLIVFDAYTTASIMITPSEDDFKRHKCAKYYTGIEKSPQNITLSAHQTEKKTPDFSTQNCKQCKTNKHLFIQILREHHV